MAMACAVRSGTSRSRRGSRLELCSVSRGAIGSLARCCAATRWISTVPADRTAPSHARRSGGSAGRQEHRDDARSRLSSCRWTLARALLAVPLPSPSPFTFSAPLPRSYTYTHLWTSPCTSPPTWRACGPSAPTHPSGPGCPARVVPRWRRVSGGARATPPLPVSSLASLVLPPAGCAAVLATRDFARLPPGEEYRVRE
jgi:hypothetical protein